MADPDPNPDPRPDDRSGRHPAGIGRTQPQPGERPRWEPKAPPGPPDPAAAKRGRRWKLGLLGVVVAAMLLCVVLVVVGSVPDPTALALSFAAAVAPAVVYGWLVLRLDRFEPEPPRALAAAFGWGAVGAVLFSILGGVVFQVVAEAAVSAAAGNLLGTVLGAPLIEETFKGLALLVMTATYRREFDNTLDGLVYGALIGLGFAMTENVLYFGQSYLEGGILGLGSLFLARAVIGGWGHAVYTGVTGAAVGWARGRYRRGFLRILVPFLGWCLAVALHLLWNAGAIALAVRFGEGAPLWETVAPLALVLLLPAVLALWVVARVSQRRQLAIVREQLEPEVGSALTPAEFATLTDERLRREALRSAAAAGGRALRRRQQRFFDAAADLAFRKHHLQQGERLAPGQTSPEPALRAQLAELRTGLPVPPAPAGPAVTL